MRLLVLFLIIILASCNNPLENDDTGQGSPNESEDTETQSQEDSSNEQDLDKLSQQLELMSYVFLDVDAILTENFDYEMDEEDLDNLEEGLNKLDETRELYLQIDVYNEIEDAVDIYMNGLHLIDVTREIFTNKIHYLESGNLDSYENSTESLGEYQSLVKEVTDEMIRLNKTYLE
ncbi:hypothetical protein [Alkalibacillus haloalkaliphilus]|uniref:hypothetical protein n=1 Tax=Alkalibacillus haloalkaliphilus TaxID=94136 RepID=UPI0029358106|nr:hypothetical protein [Alkalibacillus haloalkaliphilus]MDV2581574.1 hypothetical protein [Alkalibacillus haloalkaliphilus]